MKLDRVFTTHESEQTVREQISQYLTGIGYQLVASQPYLMFTRGSAFGSRTAFSPKKWKAVVSVQTQPANEGVTTGRVLFEIDTTGQWVVKREIEFWNKELAGVITAASGFNIETPLEAQVEQKLILEKRHLEGSKWFYWIAGLSILNSVVLLVGGSLNFLIGLGITQLVDALSLVIVEGISPEAALVVRVVAFVFNLLVAGFFVGLGILSKRSKWGFIVGMVIYALDALIFLIGPDFFSIAFHLLALSGLYGGLKAFGQIQKQKSLQPANV